MTRSEQSLKLVPYPKHICFNGGTVKGKPYCNLPPRAVKDFLPRQGSIEVRFVENSALPEEAYVLEIKADHIEIRASGYAGSLYGAIALKQVCDQYDEVLPLITVFDEPVVKHRGAQVCYGQINVSYKEEWLKKHIIELAKLHFNYLYLYLEWDFAFPSLPPVCSPDMMTPEDAREIVAFAADYNICIVPECNVLGHSSDFLSIQLMNDYKENMDEEESAKVSEGLALCPNNPHTEELVFRVLDDIIDAFSPAIIHIGGDEVSKIGGDRYCREQFAEKGKTGVLLSYFIKVRDYLSGKGIITGLWGDMLLALSGENRYDGYCEKEHLDDNLRLFEELKRDTLIYDWWYVGESEKSIRFFAEKGFRVVSAASVHGCMTSFPSFDQQKNIQKLFKDTIKYNLTGGLVTDWIYGFGYHAEQTYFNLAAGASMLWCGTDEGNFIRGSTEEKFEKDYAFIRYSTQDMSLLEYCHLAGDIHSELLEMFGPNRKGVALRKAVFYTDNPLWCYIKFIFDLDGKLEKYRRMADHLRFLYGRIVKTCRKDGWLFALKLPVVVHGYLSRAVSIIDDFYIQYDAAAKVQYVDKNIFAERLEKCAQILKGLNVLYSEPIRFAKQMHVKFGLEVSSVLRLQATRCNARKLIRYILRLKEDYRPLPTIRRLSDSLFDTDRDTWWKPRDYEWAGEKGEFQKYDIDLGQFYEMLNWDL